MVDDWSVTARYRKRGKPSCKACSEERSHGPYYYGTQVVDDRKEIRYLNIYKCDLGRSLPFFGCIPVSLADCRFLISL